MKPPRRPATNTQRRGESLQELVLTRLAELGDEKAPMSALQASKAAGGHVSYETIRLIARGNHSGRINDRIASGLALALRVPVERVYQAAGLPAPGERWEWPRRFDRLAHAQRRVIEDVAAAVLEAYEAGRRDVLEEARKSAD
jgi:hypothetical protein